MSFATSIDSTTIVVASVAVISFVLFLIFAFLHPFRRPHPQNVQNIGNVHVHNYPPGHQPATTEKDPELGKDVKLKEAKKLDDEDKDATKEQTLNFAGGASCENSATTLRKRNIKKSKSHQESDKKHHLQKGNETVPDKISSKIPVEDSNEAGSGGDRSEGESSEVVQTGGIDQSASQKKAFFDNAAVPKTQNDDEAEGAEIHEDKLAFFARKPAAPQYPFEQRGTPDGGAKPDQKEAAVVSLSSDVADNQDSTAPVTFKAESVTDPYTFAVDERGCNVTSSYCNISIPPGAVRTRQTITMSPVYDIKECLSNKAFVSPHVNFTSEKEIAFLEDVSVSIHTAYTAIDKKVPIQVMWKKDKTSGYVLHKKVLHGKDRFIRFTCRHFCGYCNAADQTDFSGLQRHYYFAGYVRRPKSAGTRVFHWTVLEDCPAKLDHTRKLLASNEIVIDPEIFSVKYGYNLQLHLDNRVVEVHGNDPHLDLVEKWGSRYLDPHQFRLENKNRGTPTSQIDYKILAIHTQNHAVIPVTSKHFFLEWTLESQPNQQTINVYDQATGVQVDQRAQLQQQTSVSSNVSDASSGYHSVPPTPSHGGSFLPLDPLEESSIEVSCEQLSLDGAGDSMTPSALVGDRERCVPLAQSTPNRRVQSVAEAEDLTGRHSSPTTSRNQSFVQQTQVEELESDDHQDRPTETVPKVQGEDAASFRLTLQRSPPRRSTVTAEASPSFESERSFSNS